MLFLDLDYNIIYEMVIKDYHYKCIKAGNDIIYTIVSTNPKKTTRILNQLNRDLGRVKKSDYVTFYLDGKLICRKTIKEVFDTKADPNTGMNIIAEESLWMNNVKPEEVDSIRDTLNAEIRKKHGK